MKNRTLILVRHAHRDTSDRERDNSLSDRGREQAKAVSRYFRERFKKESALLVSSPKVRCIETLLPLADKLGVDVKVVDLLDEQSESDAGFQRRLEKFFRWWKLRGPELVVACSHGDWIPAFAHKVLGLSVDLKKGGWLEIEARDGALSLRWILQKIA